MATNAEIVRQKLAETIPNGGTAADTMFSDAEITDLLSRNGDDVDKAVYEGWGIKAANFAGFVDSAEGTSKRSMSDLHQHALRMANSFNSSGTGSTGVTRIRPIVRR